MLARLGLFAALSMVSNWAPACEGVDGVERLGLSERTRIVWVGELHGSNEQPRLFLRLACALSIAAPVVVLLERSSDEQPAWDAFLASNGDEAARQAFLAAGGWRARDGRGSLAMLELADRLRMLHQQGRVAAVVAILSPGPPGAFDASAYEQRMSGAVRDASQRHPGTLALVYTGSLHAMNGTVTVQGVPAYQAAAARLPPGEVVSVRLETGAGFAWNCQRGDCGPHPYGGSTRPFGLATEPAVAGYDAVLSDPAPTTASPPAVGGPTQSP